MSEIKSIEGNYKLSILLSLYKQGPMKKTDVYRVIGDTGNRSYRLDELEADGLITMYRDTFDNNKTIVSLTSEGRAVAVKLLEIEGILSGEALPGDGQTDYEPSAKQRDSVN